MDLKKGQKQGRDERMQEDYSTSAKIHSGRRVVFLRSFISALFLSFFQRSFTETFPYFLFFLEGFLNHLPNTHVEDKYIYCAGDEYFLSGEQMRFALVTNALVLETNALKTCVQTSAT